MRGGGAPRLGGLRPWRAAFCRHGPPARSEYPRSSAKSRSLSSTGSLDISTTTIIPVALVILIALMGGLALIGKVPLSYNLRNLVVRWRVTVLTALAFTLVVALMTVMLAFVNGMYRLTQGSGHSENVLVLSDGSTDELFSNLGYGEIKEIELSDGVQRDDQGKPESSWEIYVVCNQPIPNAKPDERQR